MNALTERELFRDGAEWTPTIDAEEVEAVKAAVLDIFGQPVLAVTPLESLTANSFRVHLQDLTLIASRRSHSGEVDREAKTLGRLWKAGAPVPRIISKSDLYLFEENTSGVCLTRRLAAPDDAARRQLPEMAFASLYMTKTAASKARLGRPTPYSCADRIWLSSLITAPLDLSQSLGVSPPDVDLMAAGHALKAPASIFIKATTTPGDAYVCQKRGVLWRGWRDAGLGAGYEDIGQLITDENWPLAAKASLAMFRRFQADWTPQSEARLCTFAALHVCRRLVGICRGQSPNASFGVVRKLVGHGAAYAARARLMQGAVPWFESLADRDIWRSLSQPRSGNADMM